MVIAMLGSRHKRENPMSFRILGLAPEPFAHLFALTDAELAEQGAVRKIANADAGFPCRISLTDAACGDVVVLVNYLHQPARSPFRSCHAIYVRAGERTYDAIGTVPQQLRTRMLSLRGFDDGGLMTRADLVDGMQLEGAIECFFGDEATRYLHVHFAKPGCYAARVERA